MTSDVSASPPADSPVERIVVNKARRELLLFRGGQIIRTYTVSLGRAPVGAKQRQGDGKTPEGSYSISGRNPRSSFHLSLRVSYPSRADRERARREGVDPGGDIMIHGIPNGQAPGDVNHPRSDWTEGCIAVTDPEIEEIWRLVPNGTPIQINP